MKMNEKKSSNKFSKTSIVFFGSGPVAAKSLQLLKQSFNIEAVITKPTTELEMSEAGGDVPVHTVSSRKDLDILVEQNTFTSSIAVLIDFGIIVSRKVIDSFDHGIINSHFSLLPKLRGADPITFSILEGLENTGVSLMLLVEAMDEGPLLAQKALGIEHQDTTPTLTDKLIILSYEMLRDTLDDYIEGVITPYEQSSEATYTRKLVKSDGIIDWQKPAIQVEREVRAYAEWPKSKTSFKDIDCVILNATTLDIQGTPGQPFIYEKELAVYCSEGSLLIYELKPAGKKAMTSQAFLAGYKHRIGL